VIEGVGSAQSPCYSTQTRGSEFRDFYKVYPEDAEPARILLPATTETGTGHELALEVGSEAYAHTRSLMPRTSTWAIPACPGSRS